MISSVRRRLLWTALPAVAVALLIAFASIAQAAKTESTTLPPPNENCTVFFVPEKDDAQSVKDMQRVKAAFDKAIKGSKAMVEKTKDACKKEDGKVVIFVKRDDPATRLGRTKGFANSAFVIIDLGDLSALELALSGKPEDIKKFLENFIITTLAHEIDHLRGDGHDDPGANAGKGKPVEDENAVMKDLKVDITRNGYGKMSPNLSFWVEYTVDGQKLLWSLDIFERHLRIRKEHNIHTPHDIQRIKVAGIPGAPCGRGVESCYVLPPDADRDGTPDYYDNCLAWVNPQQLDFDRDGLGAGCDPDDDGDGWADAIEHAVGSSSTDPLRVPEHWTSDACFNGVDDDGDGFVDADDQSCTLPPIDNLRLPTVVPINAVYPPHLRQDLGGVPEDLDALSMTLVVYLDIDLDGFIDDEVLLDGLTVVLRIGDLATYADAEVPHIDVEMVALELTGESFELGPLGVSLVSGTRSSGQITDIHPDPEQDLPAFLRFDVYLELSTEFGILRSEVPLPLQGFVHQWPFFDDLLELDLDSPPVALFDAEGNHIADIVDAYTETPPPFGG